MFQFKNKLRSVQQCHATSSNSLFCLIVFFPLYRGACLFFNAPFSCKGIRRKDAGAGDNRKVGNVF